MSANLNPEFTLKNPIKMDNLTTITPPRSLVKKDGSLGEKEKLGIEEISEKLGKQEPEEYQETEQNITDNVISMDMEDLEDLVLKSDSEELSLNEMFLPDSSKEEEKSEKKSKSENTTLTSNEAVVPISRFPLHDDVIDVNTLFGDVRSIQGFSPQIRSIKSSIESGATILENHVSAAPSLRQEEVPIDRKLYYKLYAMYKKQYEREKQKNDLLQRKLGAYFLKRRMFHVLVTNQHIDQTSSDYQRKYDKMLDEFEAMYEESVHEEMTLKNEMESLKHHYQTKKEELNLLLANLQKKEHDFIKELGKGDENDKANAEKFALKYLEKQKRHTENLSKVRLAYIKLKMKYDETQEKLDSLDKLGSNLRLIDYEQLKTDNVSLVDKLEEKELMLTATRKQCQHATQILAHNREKLRALDDDIESYKDELETITGDWVDAREQLNYLKEERAYYRRLTNKLKTEGGLLTKPKLLKDMEKSIKESEEGWLKMKEYKNHFESVSGLVASIRRRINSVRVVEQQGKYTMPKRIPPNE